MAQIRFSRTERLRCFVAMAFDHSDTDAVFSVIKRELSNMQIRAIRIDRINHNDDIDERIISEINRADFVIADLTYARPSVYFEAGFAQRVVPVIYTVRSDHFKAKDDDPYGNFRVHFDLQMKNIIAWKAPSDRVFTQRLRARVRKVCVPLVRRREAEDESKRKVAVFTASSLREQRESLKKTLRGYFARNHYRIIDLANVVNDANFSSGFASLQRFGGGIGALCAKQEKDSFEFVFYHVVPSITKDLAYFYRMTLIEFPAYRSDMATSYRGRQRTPNRLRDEIIICTFGRGGVARMAREIPSLRPAEHGSLEMNTTWDVVQPGQITPVPRYVSVRVFESTRQLADLGERLRLRPVPNSKSSAKTQ